METGSSKIAQAGEAAKLAGTLQLVLTQTQMLKQSIVNLCMLQSKLIKDTLAVQMKAKYLNSGHLLDANDKFITIVGEDSVSTYKSSSMVRLYIIYML